MGSRNEEQGVFWVVVAVGDLVLRWETWPWLQGRENRERALSPKEVYYSTPRRAQDLNSTSSGACPQHWGALLKLRGRMEENRASFGEWDSRFTSIVFSAHNHPPSSGDPPDPPVFLSWDPATCYISDHLNLTAQIRWNMLKLLTLWGVGAKGHRAHRAVINNKLPRGQAGASQLCVQISRAVLHAGIWGTGVIFLLIQTSGWRHHPPTCDPAPSQ